MKTRTVAFLISKDRFFYRTIPLGRDTLSSHVNSFRIEIAQKKKGKSLAAGQRLYESLITPFYLDIVDAQRLYVIPDGPLHHLPFAALTDGIRYLVERVPVCNLPSADVLRYCIANRRPRELRALIMNPTRADEPADAHALALEEAEQLKKALPGSRLLTGSDATLTQFAQQALRYPLLHITAPGRCAPNDPRSSGLFLTGAGSRPDLPASTIFDMQLDACLVVLTGYSSAPARDIAGQGLVALNRAFIHAGAPSLLTSLWNVEDAAAMRLILNFYQHLADADKATALARAQRDMLIEHPEPWLWAHLVLSGDWK